MSVDQAFALSMMVMVGILGALIFSTDFSRKRPKLCVAGFSAWALFWIGPALFHIWIAGVMG